MIDTGIGMTDEQQKKLFRVFSQAEASMMKRYGGTGLGLALSKSYCQLMGGKISVESEYGVGTTFNILLPVAASQMNVWTALYTRVWLRNVLMKILLMKAQPEGSYRYKGLFRFRLATNQLPAMILPTGRKRADNF